MSNIVCVRLTQGEIDTLKKIEDEYDISAIKAYERARESGDIQTRAIDDLFEELEL